MIVLAVGVIICSYLIGSISFAVLFTKLFAHKDVRNYGSGNAGATNVIRVGGVKPGVLTFLCDFLKGVLSAFLGKTVFAFIGAQTGFTWAKAAYGVCLCGLLCVIGHVFPVFFRFKGGKGVATGAGVFLMICPEALAVAVLVFAVLFLITRIVSVCSVSATAIGVALAVFWYDPAASFYPQAVCMILIACLIIVKHSENIRRLFAGEEKPLQIGRKK